ncbi:ABC transporter permease [Thermobacillus sp.]|uniref:ABC transporter permease n=1 Tax=Thermobacillus sp. TaxID=2108467 RepID=UPI00257EB743|nr:ABC transporter permease [Thermobacillus sp.]
MYNSMTARLELDHRLVGFGDVAAAIGKAGGDIVSIDVIRPGQDKSVRDLTIQSPEQAESAIVEALRRMNGIRVIMQTSVRSIKFWLLFLTMPSIAVCLSFLLHGGAEQAELRIGVVNMDDGSRLAADAAGYLARLEQIKVSEHDAADARQMIASGELDAAVVFPERFGEGLRRGNPPAIEMVSIRGATVTGNVDLMLSAYIRNIASIGRAAQDDGLFERLYASHATFRYDLTAESIDDVSGRNRMSRQTIGYLAIILLFCASQLSNLMLHERENRTYARVLSTPVSPVSYMLSNVLTNLLVMMLLIAVALAVMTLAFGIDPGLPIEVLLIVLLPYVLTAIAMSHAVTAHAASAMKASALQNLIIIPTSLLAGCMFPIETMPESVQRIGKLFPQHWLLDAVGRLQSGAALSDVWLHLAILAAFALACALAAAFEHVRRREAAIV